MHPYVWMTIDEAVDAGYEEARAEVERERWHCERLAGEVRGLQHSNEQILKAFTAALSAVQLPPMFIRTDGSLGT